jgi:TPR repeat protein
LLTAKGNHEGVGGNEETATTPLGVYVMKPFWIDQRTSPNTAAPAAAFIAFGLATAQPGDGAAYYHLGVALSTGSNGQPCDFVEAHKWFNIAASSGHEESAMCRADVARDMTAREVAEAQRRARQWMASTYKGKASRNAA